MTSHGFVVGIAGLVSGGGVCSAALGSYLLGDEDNPRTAGRRRLAVAAGCVAVVGAVVAFRSTG
jgi:hypothetical protein